MICSRRYKIHMSEKAKKKRKGLTYEQTEAFYFPDSFCFFHSYGAWTKSITS